MTFPLKTDENMQTKHAKHAPLVTAYSQSGDITLRRGGLALSGYSAMFDAFVACNFLHAIDVTGAVVPD